MGLMKPVAFALPVTKRTRLGTPGIAIGGVRCAAIHRSSHCIGLITVRSRPVSGFISADKAELAYVIPAPSGNGVVA